MKKTFIALICVLCLCISGCSIKLPSISLPWSSDDEPGTGPVPADAAEVSQFETQEFRCGNITFKIPDYWEAEEESRDRYVFNAYSGRDLAGILTVYALDASPSLTARENVVDAGWSFYTDEVDDFSINEALHVDGQPVCSCSFKTADKRNEFDNNVYVFPAGDRLVCLVLSESTDSEMGLFRDLSYLIDGLSLPGNDFTGTSVTVAECEHDFEGANYQQGGVCTKCGETCGPLTPDFERFGGEINLFLGRQSDYVTGAKDRVEMHCKAEIIDYSVIKPDYYHQNADGWEWRRAVLTVTVPSEYHSYIATMDNIFFMFNTRDYYDVNLFYNESATVFDDYGNVNEWVPNGENWAWLYEDGWSLYYSKINWLGADRQVIYRTALDWLNLEAYCNGECEGRIQAIYETYVPVGYDGIIVGLADSRIQYPALDTTFDRLNAVYSPEKFLFFRMYALN